MKNIIIQTLSWNNGDDVIVAGDWAQRAPGLIDGVAVQSSDIVVRAISSTGKTNSRSAVISHGVPWADHPNLFLPGEFQANSAISNYASGEVAIGYYPIKVLNGQSLDTLFTYSPSSDDIQTGRAAGGFSGMTFSADRKYLFLLGANSNGDAASPILDSKTGAQIGAFPGGEMGLDASADGKLLAVGNGHSVDIFTIDSDN